MSDKTIYDHGGIRIDIGTLTGDLRVFDKGDLMAIVDDGGYVQEAIEHLRARIEELKLQRLQMNNEVPITTDKSATKGRLSVSYDAIDAAWRVMEDKNETTR